MAHSLHDTNVVPLASAREREGLLGSDADAAIRDAERHLARAGDALEAYVAQAAEFADRSVRLVQAVRRIAVLALVAFVVVWAASTTNLVLLAAPAVVVLALAGTLAYLLGRHHAAEVTGTRQRVTRPWSPDREHVEANPAHLRAKDAPRYRQSSLTASTRSSDRSPFTDGLVVERYRLLEQLGSGGFGAVWRAHDELLHREVALKRVWLGPTGDSDRAAREALAAARLSHPAIVPLYEAFTQGDAFYLISELVYGDTLAGLMARDRLNDEEALQVGIALADALEHAHSRGVIHRDIKPQNVLVPSPRVTGTEVSQPLAVAAKLADFGGASIVGEDALTRTGDVLGTLAYMAPEQCDGLVAAEQADLYSMALVIYEALAGGNPVRGATPAATARRIGSVLPSLASSRPDLPGALTHAIDLAVAPEPERRGTLGDLRLAFDDALRIKRRHARWRQVTRNRR
jgi:hypothetical protein